MDRIEAAVESHLRYQLEVSDYPTASIRNAGQIPEHIRLRYTQETSRYGAIWRKLIQDAKDDGVMRPELEPRAARMLVLGALNWAAEWWNPRRGSIEQVVRTARVLVRGGLSADPVSGQPPAAVRGARKRARPAREPAAR
jgi:hypothetical protein